MLLALLGFPFVADAFTFLSVFLCVCGYAYAHQYCRITRNFQTTYPLIFIKIIFAFCCCVVRQYNPPT